MTDASESEVTRLLKEWRCGYRDAEARLFDLVLPDLKRLAGHFMRRERAGHTLTPTALLKENETYVRLVGSRSARSYACVAGTAEHSRPCRPATAPEEPHA